LQQVGRAATASSIVIAPRRAPLSGRRGNLPTLNKINRFWVLHRKLLLRGIGALLCALLITLVFQTRGGIANVVLTVSGVLSGEFSQVGFGISEISITGQSMTAERQVLSALDLNERTSTLTFDASAARERLLALPAIAEATVRKIYPGQVIVNLTESAPVARWRINGQTFVIDAAGKPIAGAIGVDEHLPLVIGAGAADDATVIVRALERYQAIGAGLVAVSRIADRRWDLIYQSGLRVQLPENGVAQALTALEGLQTDYSLLDRDLSLIDLRVNGTLAVRLVQHEEDGAGQTGLIE